MKKDQPCDTIYLQCDAG